MVSASSTTLTSLYGIGPVIVGRILAEAGDVARFPSKDAFASYSGTAPIDVSSGDQIRHRPAACCCAACCCAACWPTTLPTR